MTSAQAGENASTPDPMQHHGYITDKDKYLKRLKRIEGQARGISRMIEEERYSTPVPPCSPCLSSSTRHWAPSARPWRSA